MYIGMQRVLMAAQAAVAAAEQARLARARQEQAARLVAIRPSLPKRLPLPAAARALARVPAVGLLRVQAVQRRARTTR